MNTTATFSADAVPEVPTAPLDNCHPPPAVCLPNTKNSPPTTSLEDSKFLWHDSPLGIDFAEGIQGERVKLSPLPHPVLGKDAE